MTILIEPLAAHPGVQLLQGTTRRASQTLPARRLTSALQLLTDLEETEAVFSTQRQNPRGTLSIDMPAGIGRYLVIPAPPMSTARYPQYRLEIGLNDRPQDPIAEGADCVLRGGLALDESLARPLAMMDQLTLASPAYLACMGVPETLDDLAAPDGRGGCSERPCRHHQPELMAARACSTNLTEQVGGLDEAADGHFVRPQGWHEADPVRDGHFVGTPSRKARRQDTAGKRPPSSTLIRAIPAAPSATYSEARRARTSHERRYGQHHCIRQARNDEYLNLPTARRHEALRLINLHHRYRGAPDVHIKQCPCPQPQEQQHRKGDGKGDAGMVDIYTYLAEPSSMTQVEVRHRQQPASKPTHPVRTTRNAPSRDEELQPQHDGQMSANTSTSARYLHA